MELPECLRDLPVDPKRKLPIPFMNQREDGTWNFLAIHFPTLLRCIRESLCGVCGKPLGYASAFVGGPLSAQSRVYSDPAFHPECAKAAMRLCPHILIGRMKRASEERIGEDATHHHLATLDKPAEWVIGIAPTRETEVRFAKDGAYIMPGKFTKTIRYPYDDEGRLQYPERG